MVVVNKRSFKPIFQERLAKEDVELLISILNANMDHPAASHTRLEMLIEKLKRMKGK
jgi:hypothetical protein